MMSANALPSKRVDAYLAGITAVIFMGFSIGVSAHTSGRYLCSGGVFRAWIGWLLLRLEAGKRSLETGLRPSHWRDESSYIKRKDCVKEGIRAPR
jgi:hypothetical protein